MKTYSVFCKNILGRDYILTVVNANDDAEATKKAFNEVRKMIYVGDGR